MNLEDAYPTPACRDYTFSSTIDFVTIHSPSPLDVKLLRELGIKVPKGPKPYAYPHVATLHNATLKKLKKLMLTCPGARIIALEVALDARPKSTLAPEARARALQAMHVFVVSRIYPWKAPGVQRSARFSRARNQSDVILANDLLLPLAKNQAFEVQRLPLPSETLYLGNSKPEWVRKSELQHGFLRIYIKRTDNNKALKADRHRVRVELNLDQTGCAAFELTTPAALLDFSFRRLVPFLQLADPQVLDPLPAGLAVASASMAALTRPTLHRAAMSSIVRAGAYTVIADPRGLAIYGVGHRRGNHKIGEMLDSLTKRFGRGPRTSGAEDAALDAVIDAALRP